jgi:predicted NAD/FAD-binding protein
MVFDVLRFNVFAKDLLRAEETVGKMSIGEYLEREGYGDGFKEDYLLVRSRLFPFYLLSARWFVLMPRPSL